MEENNMGYDPSEYDDYNEQEGGYEQKSIRGYRIVIGILAVILVAISGLYFNIHRQQQADYDLLSVARDSIEVNLNHLIVDFDELQINNDSISSTLVVERHRADSIINQLKRERSFNYTKLKQYEKEVGTLRTIMKGYLRQIDSLNHLNKQLISENVTYKKKITSVELRAEKAEEKAEELNNRVKQGSVIKARDITIATLSDTGREVSRAKRADQLRIDFTLTANELSDAGNKTIYMRLVSPDGFALTTAEYPTFSYDGQRLTYSASRDVDYQNIDLGVSIFFNGSGFTEGSYRVYLYTDGHLIGESEVVLR